MTVGPEGHSELRSDGLLLPERLEIGALEDPDLRGVGGVLRELGARAVAVGGDVLFDKQAFDQLKAGVVTHIQAHGQVTVADLRDGFHTSRKYALALLEYLDRLRITRRVGDARVLAGGGRPPGGGR